MGTGTEPELRAGDPNIYIAAPYDGAEEYLLSELETAGLHCSMLHDMIRKTYNTANSRGLDQKWGNHLSLILDHIQSDLRHLDAEIKKLRDESS